MKNKLSPILFAIVIATVQAGFAGKEGSGSRKPITDIGISNLKAALSKEIVQIIGDWDITKIRLIDRSRSLHKYLIVAEGEAANTSCELKVTIFNSVTGSAEDGEIRRVEQDSPCSSANSSGEFSNFEQLRSVLKSTDLVKRLGMNFEPKEIERIGQDAHTTHYKITASTISSADVCELRATVSNKIDAKDADFGVNISPANCTASMTVPRSVFVEFEDELEVFANILFTEGNAYSKYITAAQRIPKEKRAEIRGFMKSSNESKFAEVFEKRKYEMKEKFVNNPDITIYEFYIYLGREIMGLNVGQGGIVSPVIAGLSLAALYIVD
ncbi:MAG: hypothetical protein COT74_05575 [Bdellovibrionales bacterium CG10_big_fil_rev_8_21_14_0_10_45_34]|nr:MAG: hypothetical protein COT74_05575 [Bdellovibrionales bacterium CG10_big_fil_rev_8_21_14_0_10_45_34]